MSDPRTQLVAKSYDAIADRFVEWQRQIVDDARPKWTAALVARLPARSRVLELGCGAGLRETTLLSAEVREPEGDVRFHWVLARR